MATEVVDQVFFHVFTRALPYNAYAPLAEGMTITCGTSHNPFFGYYEMSRTFPVDLSDGGQDQVPQLTFLKRVRAGEIAPHNLPETAWQVAEHFQLLSRELMMELVRREEAPSAPSRLSCLWVVDSSAAAQHWVAKFSGDGRIVALRCTGIVQRCDASLLSAGDEVYRHMELAARQYWRGEDGARPEHEWLFSGTAVVLPNSTMAGSMDDRPPGDR